MNKYIIALGIAGMMLSQSSLAWTEDGKGGGVDLSGAIITRGEPFGWEVLVGSPSMDINTVMEKDTQQKDIILNSSVPVLGIRTIGNKARVVTAASGITPFIDYGGKVDVSGFVKGKTTLTLDIMSNDAASTKLGVLTAEFTAVGKFSRIDLKDPAHSSTLISSVSSLDKAGNKVLFFGGVGENQAAVAETSQVISESNAISPDYAANFDDQGITHVTFWPTGLYSGWKYSVFYGAGIKRGTAISLKFDNPISANLKWKASLPIVITYL